MTTQTGLQWGLGGTQTLDNRFVPVASLNAENKCKNQVNFFLPVRNVEGEFSTRKKFSVFLSKRRKSPIARTAVPAS